MTVDYDLIIVGNAPLGRDAALRASQTGARVALVTASDQAEAGLEPAIRAAFLAQLNRSLGQQDWLHQGLHQRGEIQPGQGFPLDWSQTVARIKALAETLEGSTGIPTSLTHLMTSGVDVIQAAAEFRQRPRLSLFAERLLRSRAYLLTPLAQAAVPPISGLAQFATCADWPYHWSAQPASLVILGTDPQGLLLAQLLNRLGTQVTLLTQSERLLADPDLSRALQLRFEAEGVTVLTRTEVRRIEPTAAGTILRLRDLSEYIDPTEQVLEAEAILLATTPCFDLAALRLEAVGVVWQPDRIPVNRRLQTSQPRIYACGSAAESAAGSLGSEVELALHNALFWPPRSADGSSSLRFLPTDPEVAWVGLTEAAARQRYGAEIRVAQPSERSRLVAQAGRSQGGFLKLIVHREGKLLGAQAIGAAAVASLEPAAMAMRQNLKLKDLARLLPGTGSTELLQQAVRHLQLQHLKQSPRWRRELIEAWFDFRRSR